MNKIKSLVMPFVWVLARLFLGSIYLYAGYSKLIQPVANFRGLLREYTILPAVLVPFLAWLTPWIEVIAGLCLILGFLTRLSALGLSLLSLVFLVVLALSQWLLGTLPESCGCFGEGIQLTVAQVMWLDLFNFALGLALFFRRRHLWTLDARLSRPA